MIVHRHRQNLLRLFLADHILIENPLDSRRIQQFKGGRFETLGAPALPRDRLAARHAFRADPQGRHRMAPIT